MTHINNPIVKILMERDELSYIEAEKMLLEGRRRVWIDMEDPGEVLEEDFGLEPDYFMDLVG
jgi:hypothetical protein